MAYCSYYQATIERKNHCFIVAILKSFDYVCFDRTIDAQKGVFEFFVPVHQEPTFLALMDEFKRKGLMGDVEKMPNRLEHEEA